MPSLEQAANYFGITAKTLATRLQKAAITPVTDEYDHRKKLLTDEQMEILAYHYGSPSTGLLQQQPNLRLQSPAELRMRRRGQAVDEKDSEDLKEVKRQAEQLNQSVQQLTVEYKAQSYILVSLEETYKSSDGIGDEWDEQLVQLEDSCNQLNETIKSVRHMSEVLQERASGLPLSTLEAAITQLNSNLDRIDTRLKETLKIVSNMCNDH